MVRLRLLSRRAMRASCSHHNASRWFFSMWLPKFQKASGTLRKTWPLHHRSFADSALRRAETASISGIDFVRRRPREKDLRRAALLLCRAFGFRRRAIPNRGFHRRQRRAASLSALRLTSELSGRIYRYARAAGLSMLR